MDRDALGQGLVAVLHAVVALAVLSTLVPRTYQLWRYRDLGNGLQAVRLSTWLKSAGVVLVAVWGFVVRADLLLFDQAVLGRFSARWPWDAAVWLVLAVGAVKVAALYWRTVRHHEERGS